MKVFDCFLFNDEIEILLLRLKIMGPYVDEFLIIESSKTFSGIEKRGSNFKKNEKCFSDFINKVNYHFIKDLPQTNSAWDLEHFLRDTARSLIDADDDDLVIIGDVDEILNMPIIFSKLIKNSYYSLIELKTYYYYLNCRSTELINVTLISEFKNIKYMFLGNRAVYKTSAYNLIEDLNGDNGGHFTYQFNADIDKYIKKIRGFSHQELNNDFYLNRTRLRKCIRYKVDLFERDNYTYTIIPATKLFADLKQNISGTNLWPLSLAPVYSLYDLLKWFDPFYLKIMLRKARSKYAFLKRADLFIKKFQSRFLFKG